MLVQPACRLAHEPARQSISIISLEADAEVRERVRGGGDESLMVITSEFLRLVPFLAAGGARTGGGFGLAA